MRLKPDWNWACCAVLSWEGVLGPRKLLGEGAGSGAQPCI